MDTQGGRGARRSVIGKCQPGKTFWGNELDAMSNSDHEMPVPAYPSMNSPPPSIPQVYGSTLHTMQGTSWNFQNSGRSSYSAASNAVLYGSTTYQLGSPNGSSQNLMSQPCKNSASTSDSITTNSVSNHQTSAAWGPVPTACASHLATTNTTSWPADIYSADSTEEIDIAAQLDWEEATNGGAR